MPIALYAAPTVEAMLHEKFGKETFIDNDSADDHRQDNPSDPKPQFAIVQLDTQPGGTDKGAFPGLHWLEHRLSERKIPADTPIIITAWNAEIFGLAGTVRLRTHLGTHPRTNLLASPLINFLPLAELMSIPTGQTLFTRFPRIPDKQKEAYNRLIEDIEQNCYTRLGVSSRCHRLRRLVYEYWEPNPDYTGEHIFKYFAEDIDALSLPLLFTLPEPERGQLTEKIGALHRTLRDAPHYEAFQGALLQLEKLLIPRDESPPRPFPPLNTHVIIINPKQELVADLIDRLREWGVAADWVATWKDAERSLNSAKERYCCLFSNFRNFEPDGKLTTGQGYDNLYALRLTHPLLPSAFLTSMSQARWEQPGYERWPAFDLKELMPFTGKSVYALYFFLKKAEDERVNRYARIPTNCKRENDKNPFQHMDAPGMAGEALRYLKTRTEEARRCVHAYCCDKKLGLNWPVSTRYRTRDGFRDRSFVFERLFYRLTILAMLRQPYWHAGTPASPDLDERRRRVNECIWLGVDRQGRPTYAKKGNDCSEYLRIDRSVPYHQGDLDDLYRDSRLFYHERQLLPILVISQEQLQRL